MENNYCLKLSLPLFNWSMLISSNNKEILLIIKRMFKNIRCSFLKSECKSANIVIDYVADEYVITYNDAIYKTSSINSIIEIINSNWFQRFSLTSNDFIFLHGGLFLYKNKCCLLLGPTHCGKSTLIFQLTSNKHILYGGDDIIPISIKDGRIFPFANPIHLRNNNFINEYRCDKHIIFKSENDTFSIFLNHFLNFPCDSIDYVFYLDRKLDQDKISLVEISNKMNFELLLQNCWANIELKKRIRTLLKMANNCKGYILKFNNQNSAEYIIDFIERSF